MIYDPHRSTIFDLDANLVAGFCYLMTLLPLGWLSLVALIVIFFVEKQSDFVKFHAAQSFSISCLLYLLGRIVVLVFSLASITTPFAIIDIISTLTFGTFGSILALALILISLAVFILRVYLMVQAFRYREAFIPLFGHFADFLCRKLSS